MNRTDLQILQREVEELFHEEEGFIKTNETDESKVKIAFVYLAFLEGYHVSEVASYLKLTTNRIYEMKREAANLMNTNERYYLKVRELM